MIQPSDFFSYPERPAANCNVDTRGDDAVVKSIQEGRDKAAALLKKPDLSQAARDFAERHLAKANRWLKRVEVSRYQFTQARVLARMRLS